jgi:hypothetical protein
MSILAFYDPNLLTIAVQPTRQKGAEEGVAKQEAEWKPNKTKT